MQQVVRGRLDRVSTDSGVTIQGRSYASWMRSAALLGLFCVSVKTFLLEAFYIPSRSMFPTLQSDDYIVVPKLAYGIHLPFSNIALFSWASPTRGDVVVFHRTDDPATTTDESAQSVVKRVIGLGGDRIAIVGSKIYRNGEELIEPYVRSGRDGMLGDQVFVVPDGRAFVLGDNRGESYDSRFWREPYVPLERIVGPVSAVYWSARQPERSGLAIH